MTVNGNRPDAKGDVKITVPEVDDAPTATSSNPVKSKGIWSAIWGALTALPDGFVSLYDWCVSQLGRKLDKTDVDAALSADSTNPVQNKTVKAALDTKQGKLVAGTNITIAEDGKTISASVTVDEVLSSTSANPVQNQWLGKRLGATASNSVQIGFGAKAGKYSGQAVDGFGGDNGLQVAMGHRAEGSEYGTAVGYSADGSYYGAAVGHSANGSAFGAAVGHSANGSAFGAAVGASANGSSHGAAVGANANGSTYGTAVGRFADGSDYGTAVGSDTIGSGYGAAVGRSAETNSVKGAVAVGYEARADSDTPIVIGGSQLADTSRITVSNTGVLKVGGKEVCGGNIKTTHAELVTLRTNNSLIPGQRYRITDYVTTVGTNSGYGSAGHQFDLIVVADTVNRLNHRAHAVANTINTDFTDVNFAKWEVWYDIVNDTSKYPWADVGGKGVIYRLIDEWGNDLPYDFKNITLEGSFTFSSDGVNGDGSLTGNFYNISVQRLKNGVLPWNTFTGSSCYGITIDHTCTGNTFSNAHNVTLKAECVENTISGTNIYIGYRCYQNKIAGALITLAGNCAGNVVGGGEESYNISFGIGCKHIIFGLRDESTLYYAHNIMIYPGVNTLSFTGLPDGKQMQNIEIRSGIYNKIVAITSDNKLYSDSLAVLRPPTVTTTVT